MILALPCGGFGVPLTRNLVLHFVKRCRCVQYAVKLQPLFIVCFNAFSSLVDVAEPQFFSSSGGLKDVAGVVEFQSLYRWFLLCVEVKLAVCPVPGSFVRDYSH
jgi:hypothetical protein